MVRRVGRGVVHMPGVLSDGAPGRLPLCAARSTISIAASASGAAHRSAGGGARVTAHWPFRSLEIRRVEPTSMADPLHADGHDRAALYGALRYEPAAAKLAGPPRR